MHIIQRQRFYSPIIHQMIIEVLDIGILDIPQKCSPDRLSDKMIIDVIIISLRIGLDIMLERYVPVIRIVQWCLPGNIRLNAIQSVSRHLIFFSPEIYNIIRIQRMCLSQRITVLEYIQILIFPVALSFS